MIPSGTRYADPAPELTAAELAAWRGMLRVTHRLRQVLGETLTREHGLSMADYDALVALHDAGPERGLRMAELARTILQPPSSLTRIISSLESRRLVHRESSPDDGRGAIARLTPTGARVYAEAHRTHLRGIRARFLDHLDHRQLDQLARTWKAIDPGVHH